MGKFISCLLIFLFHMKAAKSQVSDSSTTPSVHSTYEAYMKKRATNNTVGFVLLGTGLLASAISYSTYASNDFNGVWKSEGVFIAGGLAAICSIPFFNSFRGHKVTVVLQ